MVRLVNVPLGYSSDSSDTIYINPEDVSTILPVGKVFCLVSFRSGHKPVEVSASAQVVAYALICEDIFLVERAADDFSKIIRNRF